MHRLDWSVDLQESDSPFVESRMKNAKTQMITIRHALLIKIAKRIRLYKLGATPADSIGNPRDSFTVRYTKHATVIHASRESAVRNFEAYAANGASTISRRSRR